MPFCFCATFLWNCIEQEQSGLFGHLWQSIMGSLWAMDYVKCYVKTEVMECNGHALRRGPEPQVWTLVKDPICTLIWVGLPPLLGYENSHLQPHNAQTWLSWVTLGAQGASTPLDSCHHCSLLAWDLSLPLHLGTCQWLGLCAWCSLCSFLSHKHCLSACNLCVSLLAHWGGLPW